MRGGQAARRVDAVGDEDVHDEPTRLPGRQSPPGWGDDVGPRSRRGPGSDRSR
jgi:hypothetical protein